MTSRSHPVIEMNDLDHDLDTDIDVDDGHSLITDPNSNAFDFESGSLYDDLLSGPISLSDIGTGDFGSAVIDDIIEEEEEEQIIEDVQKTEYEGIVNVNDREIEVEEDEDEGEDIGDIEIVATPIAPLQPPTPVQQPGALKKQSSSLLHKVDDLKDDSLPTIEKFLDVMDTKIEIKYSDEVIKQVSNGFLELFGVPLTRMTERLQEFSKTQHQLLSAIDAETEKFQKIPEELQEIGALFSQIPGYQNKIIQIQREMQSLTARVEKVKVRSNKLMQRKKQDDEEDLVRLKKIQEKEQLLLAKEGPSEHATPH